MEQSPHAFLIVVEGEPYSAGYVLPLAANRTLLGRSSEEHQPDLAFDSPYISRQHATIEFNEGSHVLIDLDSRHGTHIDGARLTPGEAYDLKDRVRIVLARDAVVLTFSVARPIGSDTWDYAESQPEALAAGESAPAMTVDLERCEVIIDGRVLNLVGKRYDLLCLLYENRGRVVSHVEIKRVVWQERELGADGMPLVANEEVATLISRLRDWLGPYDGLVRTFRGRGYMLDLD